MSFKEYEEKIKELIKMTEKEYPKAKKKKDIILIGTLKWGPFVTFVFLILYLFLIALEAAFINLTFSDIVEYTSLIFSLVALFFALYGYVSSISEKNFLLVS